MRSFKKGFTALFSVIIISFLLLSIAITTNFSGFFSRFNILDSESKSVSAVLAKNCLIHANLVLASNIEYLGTQEVIVGNKKCNFEISTGGNIKSWAVVNKSHTIYKGVVDLGDVNLSIISLKECPALDSCF